MVGVTVKPAVIGHQEASHGIQKLLALQVVVVPHPPVGELFVEHMGKTDHTFPKVREVMFFCVSLKYCIQRIGQEGGIDSFVPFRHQAGQGDLYTVLRMLYGNAVYLGSRFHKDGFRYKVCGINEVAQGAGDPFRAFGGIQTQLFIVFPISAGVGCHSIDGV